MKCPIDGSDLVMAERQGVEIDYCPKCRGIWLDRGELDKIIERSDAAAAQPSVAQSRSEPASRPNHRQSDYDHHQQHNPRDKKRKSSFLGDLFDFGD